MHETTLTADHYAAPHPIDDLTLAFPAALGDLLPPLDIIPTDYPNRHDWTTFQGKWFAGVLPQDCQMEAAPGIDAQHAGRHLSAIQGSFEPRHEHKVAAVAWLASLWFTRVTSPATGYTCPAPPADSHATDC